MKKVGLITAGVVLLSTIGYSQVKIGDNPSVIGAGSLLELESTTKTLLLPRMNTSQQNLIASPVAGMIVYNTDSTCLTQYTSAGWRSLCRAAGVSLSTPLAYSVGFNPVGPGPAFSMGATTSSQVNFTDTSYNSGSAYTTSPTDSRFTAPVGGVYHFDLGLVSASSPTTLGNVSACLTINNNTVYCEGFFGGGALSILSGVQNALTINAAFSQVVISHDFKLNAGDVVRVTVSNNNSAPVTFSLINTSNSYFNGHLVR